MGVREAKKEARRAAIVAAGLEGFGTRGYEGCSVEQITAEVGIARGTFYLYFDDKHALFEALADQLYGPLVSVLEATTAQLAEADGPAAQQMIYMQMALGLSAALVGAEALVPLHVRESRSPSPAGETVRRWLGRIEGHAVSILEQAVASGQVRPHDPYVGGLAIVGAAERMAWAWFSGDERLDRETVAAQLHELFWRGIQP